MATAADPFAALRPEFSAEDGTFLFKLRCKLVWDKTAFDQLLSAMSDAAINGNSIETIPKWVAEGFWYLDSFIPNWSSHPDFRREFPDEYYERAYDVVHELADRFFMGNITYGMKTSLLQKIRKASV